MSDSTGSPRRKLIYSMTVSDAQVRRNLHDHFDQVAGKFSTSKPKLIEHKKEVDPMWGTVPAAIWSGNPGKARIELKKYVAAFTKEQRTALSDVSAATAELYNKPYEKASRTIPSIVKLLQLLQEMSMDPEAKIADFDDRIDEIRNAIHDNASTKKERKERRKSMQALDTDTPTKLTKAEKKVARLSYDPSKIVAIPKLAEECVANNPEFIVFSFYKWEVAKQNGGTSHAEFDVAFESKVLSKFGKLKGASIETVKSQLQKIAESRLHFGRLRADPYKMLDSSVSQPADQGQLMPVLFRMVVRAAIQHEHSVGKYRQLDDRPIFKVPDSPYLESQDFKDDYKQLQISLAQQTAKTVLNQTLVQKAARRRIEKEDEKNETATSPTSKKSPKSKEKASKLNKKSGTTTTTATTPITTTTNTTLVGNPVDQTTAGASDKVQVKRAAPPEPTLPYALDLVFDGAVDLVKALKDEFGPELVLTTFLLINASKVVGVTGSTITDPDTLSKILTLANLDPSQADKLKEAGKVLKDNLVLLGTVPKAIALSSFLLNISKRVESAPKPNQVELQATSE